MEEEEKEEVQGEEMHCRRQETRLKVEGAISRTSTLASHANRPTTVFVFHEMHPPHSLFLFIFWWGGETHPDLPQSPFNLTHNYFQ